ncbi:HlyD family secretion protein [Salinihabitans flavidus]|uniref:HlyD family secretion protein n=1 Tax=Salinihabitans flavidus TaxID=569882 RepID=A0A1H8S7V7_9RHOB|nr:HlyD family efflux transporter periplasmic adaptor subunit [Salinihabitans flavidus]SEO74800.1 HlyD family secretion protein [Salinihabitans flavidus]
MRFLRHGLTGLFLLSVTVGLLLFAAQMIRGAIEDRMSQEARVPQVRERVFAVNVTEAVPRTEVPELVAFGEVRSRRNLEVRTAVGGTVVHLSPRFEDGGQVRAGERLVEIDPADAKSAVAQARADVADAEAEARDAERALALARDELAAAREQAELRERALTRQRELEARGVGTAAAVETAELAASAARQAVLARRQAVAQAETRLDQSKTRIMRAGIVLDEAERRLADTRIEADFDGTLSEVSIVAGRRVSANEKLAVLIDPEALEVAFRVSTPQYARLLDDAGGLRSAEVTVTLEAMSVGLTATGTLSRDSAAVGEGQIGRQLFAQLEGARGFKPGDFVTVRVREAPLERVVRLPATAVDAADRVLVLGGDDRLEALAVTVLRRQGDDVLVRGDGLAGREVVTQRTPLLGPGILVRPLRREGEAAQVPEVPDMLDLSEDRRARLMAYVEGNARLPDAVKERLLSELSQPRVPARTVSRIEARMGG